MAIFIQLTRTRAPRWFVLTEALFSSFRRHGVTRRSMASDPTATRFDFLVIGGGSGGLAGARRASELGAATAVIESHKLGGTCVSKNKKNTVILPDYSLSNHYRLCSSLSHTCRLPGSLRSLRIPFVEVFFVYNKHCWKFKASQPISTLPQPSHTEA